MFRHVLAANLLKGSHSQRVIISTRTHWHSFSFPSGLSRKFCNTTANPRLCYNQYSSKLVALNISLGLVALCSICMTSTSAKLDTEAAQKRIKDGQSVTTIQGKVAIVTGGCGSIGMAICKALAKRGCKVAIVDIDASKVKAFQVELQKAYNIECFGITMDVSDEKSVRSGYRQIKSKLGDADILVNLAGILSNNKLLETTSDEWHKVHAVNYDSCFYLSKECVPHMMENQFGRIVNMSSWAWKSGGLTAGTAYSASKAAIVGLTFSLARQFAGDGITVNAVAPCYVFSPMIMEQLTEEQRDELLEKIPVHRFCTPEEVAHCIDFLISPLSSFITGECIDMNAGFQMD